jgi:hypothetical protein
MFAEIMLTASFSQASTHEQRPTHDAEFVLRRELQEDLTTVCSEHIAASLLSEVEKVAPVRRTPVAVSSRRREKKKKRQKTLHPAGTGSTEASASYSGGAALREESAPAVMNRGIGHASEGCVLEDMPLDYRELSFHEEVATNSGAPGKSPRESSAPPVMVRPRWADIASDSDDYVWPISATAPNWQNDAAEKRDGSEEEDACNLASVSLGTTADVVGMETFESRSKTDQGMALRISSLPRIVLEELVLEAAKGSLAFCAKVESACASHCSETKLGSTL